MSTFYRSLNNAVIGFNESVLFRCRKMGELLINLHFLQVIPNKLSDKLAAVIITEGDALDWMLFNDPAGQPFYLLLTDTPPNQQTQDLAALHIQHVQHQRIASGTMDMDVLNAHAQLMHGYVGPLCIKLYKPALFRFGPDITAIEQTLFCHQPTR